MIKFLLLDLNSSSKSDQYDTEKQVFGNQVEATAENKLTEKIKPKQMVGLFPLDLRSELKLRCSGKSGNNLKKSITKVDVPYNNETRDDSDENAREKLSLKEKLQTIARSSSRSSTPL